MAKVVLENLEVLDLEVEDQGSFQTATLGTQVLTVVRNEEYDCWQEPQVGDEDVARAIQQS